MLRAPADARGFVLRNRKLIFFLVFCSAFAIIYNIITSFLLSALPLLLLNFTVFYIQPRI